MAGGELLSIHSQITKAIASPGVCQDRGLAWRLCREVRINTEDMRQSGQVGRHAEMHQHAAERQI
eukprot:3537366-Pleurochrysis_carterae.AAC.3